MKKIMALALAAMMIICSMAAFAAEEADNTAANTEETTIVNENTEGTTEQSTTEEDAVEESTTEEGTVEEGTTEEDTTEEGTTEEGTTEDNTETADFSIIMLQINNNLMFKNDTEIELDVPAQLINDRTMVPMRAIFEALDAKVDWDDATQTAIGEKDGVVIKITIDSNTMYVGETAVEIDVPAQLVNDRTLVPVRAISEAFGSEVTWDEATETVIIKSAVTAEEGTVEEGTTEEGTTEEGTTEEGTTEEGTTEEGATEEDASTDSETDSEETPAENTDDAQAE